MAKKGTFEKVVVLHKSKSWSVDEDRNKSRKNNTTNRFLISINVLGGSGPLWIVVNENDVVFYVIETALKCHARQGRLPILGSDPTDFVLYCSHAGSDDALGPSEPIASFGTRKFVLCEKPASPTKTKTEARSKSKMMIGQKRSGGWKSFSFTVRSALDWAIGARA